MIALVLILLLASIPASAAESKHSAAYAIEQDAEKAEQDGNPAKAIELFQEAIRRDASDSPVTTSAKERMSWLQARSEQDFKPLVALQRFQQRRVQDIHAEDVEAFERQVDALPAGVLRRECRAFIADAWLRILRNPQKGLEAHQKWLAEPDLEDAQKRIAAAGLGLAQSRVDQANRRAPAPAEAPKPPEKEGNFALRFVAILAAVILAIVIGVRWRR
jgi:hypothetical protein